MRICVDTRMLNSSGIGTVILNFLKNFKDEFALVLIGNELDILPHVQEMSNVSIVPTKVPIYSIAEQLELPRLIPECDIFWSPHYNVPLLPIKAKKRIVTIHDVYHFVFRQTLSFSQKTYSSMLINQAISRSDRVITVSLFSKAEIIKYTKAKPAAIEVFYNGVNRETFRPIRDSNLLLQTKLKFGLPDRYLLCVGNVKPHKNLKQLMAAIKLMGNSFDYKVVVVGKKEGFRTNDPILFKSINDGFMVDRVIFTGYVSTEDLVNIYNLASMFVFPSIYEGFGLPPLEAMACGCPTLASNAASIPEICRDGVRYFDPHDPYEIALSIKAVLSSANENQLFVKKGIDIASSFSWKKNYEQYFQLFSKLLST